MQQIQQTELETQAETIESEQEEEKAQTRRKPKGFTFVELLVIMIILTLIVGFVGVQFLGEAQKAKRQASVIQIKNLESALTLYRLHNSRYPTSDQGLQALLTKPDLGLVPKGWQGPYLQGNNLPKDGWQGDFVYQSDGQDYTIFSLGADGVEGGSDLDADISSKEL